MNAKILIVEDEAITAMDITSVLKSLDYEVVSTASRGKEAIQKAKDLKPDLVLMDITLKGDIDGIEAASNIMALFDIPVIYLTAFSDEKTFERAKLTKPYGFITKPINHNGLRASIENALYKHSLDEKLKESEEKYHSLFQNSMVAVLLTIPEGTVLDANPAAEKMFGYSEEEICKLGRSRLVDTEDPRLYALLDERVLNGKAHGELTFIRKDGTKFEGEISSNVFKDMGGNERTSMVIKDISKRKQIEEELRQAHDHLEELVQKRTDELENAYESLKESEEKFRLIFNKAKDSIVLNEMNENGLPGKIIEANEATSKRLGYTKEELLDMNPADIVAPEKRAEMPKNAAEIRKKGYAIFEIIHVTKDGKRIPVEVINHLIEFKGRKTALTVVRDITDRKQVEEQLKETINELQGS